MAPKESKAAAAPPPVESEPAGYWDIWSKETFPGTPRQREKFKLWVREQETKPTDHEAVQWIYENVHHRISLGKTMPFIEEAVHDLASERQQKCSPSATIKLPGYGLTLDAMPSGEHRFPILMGDQGRDWKAATLTTREICMLKVIDELTNKPEWWRKVNDAKIVKKWKKEALENDWNEFIEYADFTPAMADACIKEIKLKADLYEKTGLVPVMDCSACVLKSDKLIPDDLRTALLKGVAKLEDVPEDRKDWHPGSNGLVLDLVHPSLWPLLYGRSRILPDRTINLTDCLENCGKGDIISNPHPLESTLASPNTDSDGDELEGGIPSLSSRFQWLPCDVIVDEAGNAKIDSYINNLHPIEHADLYPVIEKFITIALPAWDIVYRWPKEFSLQRLFTLELNLDCQVPEICKNWCEERNRPLEVGEEPRSDDEMEVEMDDSSSSDDDPVPVPTDIPTTTSTSSSNIDDPKDKDKMDVDEDSSSDEEENKKTEEKVEKKGLKSENEDAEDSSNKEEVESEVKEGEGEEADDEDGDEEEEGGEEGGEEEEGEEEEGEGEEEEEEEMTEQERRDREWFIKTHPLQKPEPDSNTVHLRLNPSDVKSSGFFNNARRLQVIVKLANIHLTPEKPDYEGGSWHIEGQLNEHIVSTALFYYDSENITDCILNFRTPANREDLSVELGYTQSDFVSITRMFAIDAEGTTLQDVGGVLTRQGRALFFPNVYQHQVAPFSLADKTKPGHRKILAMFLVDPAIPVISTANVPPQQKDWWTKAKVHQDGLELAGRLPPEIARMVSDRVDFPIEEEEAKKIREELMKERTVLQTGTDGVLNAVQWSFCEH